MPFSSKSCEFGRFSSCLKWQNWLLLDISHLPMLHSDKFVLPIIQMCNDPPIYLCVKECILRAYSASVCTWDSCYQPCHSDSLGGRMRPLEHILYAWGEPAAPTLVVKSKNPTFFWVASKRYELWISYPKTKGSESKFNISWLENSNY